MIHNITIVGVGWMGRTIAPACARGGCNVVIHDLKEEILEQVTESAKYSLDLLRENEVMTADEVTSAMSRIRGTTKLEDALKDADLVIEALPEILDIKKETFGQMDKIAEYPACSRFPLLNVSTDVQSVTTRSATAVAH